MGSLASRRGWRGNSECRLSISAKSKQAKDWLVEAAMTDAAHYIGKAGEFERLAKEARDQTLK